MDIKYEYAKLKIQRISHLYLKTDIRHFRQVL